MDELECPNCNVLIDVSEIDLYEIIICSDCGVQLEYVGNEFIMLD